MARMNRRRVPHDLRRLPQSNASVEQLGSQGVAHPMGRCLRYASGLGSGLEGEIKAPLAAIPARPVLLPDGGQVGFKARMKRFGHALLGLGIGNREHIQIEVHVSHAHPQAFAQFHDEATLQSWWNSIEKQICVLGEKHCRYQFSLNRDTNDNSLICLLDLVQNGIHQHYEFRKTFFESGEYTQLEKLAKLLHGLLVPGEAVIARSDREEQIDSFAQAVDWLIKEARRGQTIQRYKGLGEMNPDQLWETTLDPAVRRMLKVNITDAMIADEIFTTLMGDHVEPRRDFIQENALKVKYLDV